MPLHSDTMAARFEAPHGSLKSLAESSSGSDAGSYLVMPKRHSPSPSLLSTLSSRHSSSESDIISDEESEEEAMELKKDGGSEEEVPSEDIEEWKEEKTVCWGSYGPCSGLWPFPPPIPSLARMEKSPSRMIRPLRRRYEDGGILVIKEVRVPEHEYFIRVRREPGRLLLYLFRLNKQLGLENNEGTTGGRSISNAHGDSSTTLSKTVTDVQDDDGDCENKEHIISQQTMKFGAGGDEVQEEKGVSGAWNAAAVATVTTTSKGRVGPRTAALVKMAMPKLRLLMHT